MIPLLSQRLAIAALATASAAAVYAGSPGVARANTPTDDGASEDVLTDPSQDAQVGLAADTYADTDPSALTDFGPTLDPHGTWADDPNYGLVWSPSADEVGADFSPYVSEGHWAYDDDYVWVSDYAWGWVPFHYGRWAWLQGRGWSWIPGRLYANAWVTWRLGGEDATTYIGWAPAQPTWGWRDGVAGLLGFASLAPFVFCPAQEIFAPSVAPRVVSGEPAASVMARSRPYVKASPAVGPSVGPSVGPAAGPPPARFGIDTSRIPRAVHSDAAVMHARQFARPSTAVAIGARAPVVHVVHPRLVQRVYVPQRAMPRPLPLRRR